MDHNLDNPLEGISLSYNWVDKTILIIEDSHSCFKYFTEILKRTGVKIIRAETGPEALDICCHRREKLSLVMVDIQIPFINGIDVIREIRRSRPNLPIIAETAYTSNDIKRRSYIAGCHDYLVKPIPPAKLLETLQVYMETASTRELVWKD